MHPEAYKPPEIIGARTIRLVERRARRRAARTTIAQEPRV